MSKPATANLPTESRIEVTPADLPLHCPLPGHSLWNAHPRVFLPIEAQGGTARCPYCGIEYVLKETC
ncbi:MAG TPA: zinc-finger domain-containing protein [Thiotrichales bacterium]|nr:zinc-finger domain-containing protein [Thiotrichales bacterium]